MAVALGDLRVAEQVDAGPPHRGLLDERRQHQVPAVRATEDDQPSIRPRLLGRPPCCIDHIVDVRVAPLAVVGTPELAPVAGRAAVVHLQVGESLADEVEPEWPEGSIRLVGGAAMGADDRRDALATALARRPDGPPQVAFDPEPVSGRERDALGRRHATGGQGRTDDRRERGRHLAGTRVIRRDARHRQQPQVLRSRLALADRRNPSAVGEPADLSPDAVPGVDPLAGGRRAERPGRLRGSTSTALRRRFAVECPDHQVHEAVVDLDVDEARPVRRRIGLEPDATAELDRVDAVLAFTRREHDPVTPIGRQPHDVGPAVGVGHEQDRTVGQPARERVETGLAGDRSLGAGCDVDQHDLRGFEVVGAALGRDGNLRSVGRPGQGRDVDACRGEGARLRSSRLIGGPAATRHGASMIQTCDQPRRRETKASRFPSGDQRGACVPALWPVTFARREPSASITQISSSRTNARRRPSGDHCGSLTGCSDAVSWVG